MRADIHDGPEHNTLQSEAGYIDARPLNHQIDENLLQRAAGPYIWVNRYRSLAVEPDAKSAVARKLT